MKSELRELWEQQLPNNELAQLPNKLGTLPDVWSLFRYCFWQFINIAFWPATKPTNEKHWQDRSLPLRFWSEWDRSGHCRGVRTHCWSAHWHQTGFQLLHTHTAQKENLRGSFLAQNLHSYMFCLVDQLFSQMFYVPTFFQLWVSWRQMMNAKVKPFCGKYWEIAVSLTARPL